jgi:uncharacterized membrane protein HdeD (DUF308 family)
MKETIKEHFGGLWWLSLITGIASIIFGIATLVLPGVTLISLIVMFAAFILALGVVEIVRGFSSTHIDKTWWLSVLLGILLTIVGVYLAKNPGLSVAAFISTVIFVLITKGLCEIAIGIILPVFKVYHIISGILDLLTGIIVIVYPFTGTLALTWALGLYALIEGIVVMINSIVVFATYKEVTSKK